MTCDRVAIYAATVAGQSFTYAAPIREGVFAPPSVSRNGNVLELRAILTSQDVFPVANGGLPLPPEEKSTTQPTEYVK